MANGHLGVATTRLMFVVLVVYRRHQRTHLFDGKIMTAVVATFSSLNEAKQRHSCSKKHYGHMLPVVAHRAGCEHTAAVVATILMMVVAKHGPGCSKKNIMVVAASCSRRASREH